MEEIFSAVLDLDNADKRAAFLDEACAGNEALRRRVEAELARALENYRKEVEVTVAPSRKTRKVETRKAMAAASRRE